MGARGYCASNVRTCLCKLGFNNNVSRETIKTLGLTYLKSSFAIWLARDTNCWKQDSLTAVDLSNSSLKSNNASSSKSQTATRKSRNKTNAAKIPKPSSVSHASNSCERRPGFINKGNSCYISAILQCLRVIPDFWTNVPLEGQGSLSNSFHSLMGQLSTSKVALDPSAFIMALKNDIFKAGNTNIDLAQQQDASEILEHVVTELSKDSIFASESRKVRLKITTTCEICIEAQEAEEGSFILKLPVKDNIQSSLLNAFDAEQLQSVFCHFCESRSPVVREHSISDCGKYLIIQQGCKIQVCLNEKFYGDGSVAKDTGVECCRCPVNNLHIGGLRHWSLCYNLGRQCNAPAASQMTEQQPYLGLHCSPRFLGEARKVALKIACLH